MRRKFGIAFLLVFILAVPCGPANSGVASDWSHGAAPFTPAIDGSQSPDSIPEFKETTSDNVLFYPDEFQNTTEQLADSGVSAYTDGDSETETNTYTATQASDDTEWIYGCEETGGTASITIEMTFDISYITGIKIETIGYHIEYNWEAIGIGITDQGGNVSLWDYTNSEWDVIEAPVESGSEDWYNDTVEGNDHYNTTHIKLQFYAFITDDGSTGSVHFDIDYVGLEVYYLTNADSDHFGESFADVSEWVDDANFAHVDDTFSTDGDVITKNNDWDGGTDYDYIYTNTPSIDTSSGSWYIEFVIKSTATLDFSWVRIRDEDGASGNFQDFDYGESSDWKPIKGLITLDAVESVWLCARDDDSDTVQYVDYIRISPSDEMGWQHDGSTTEGVTGSATSDGDKLNITGSTEIAIDTTATAAMVSTTYYPFLDISVTDGSGTWSVEVYDGSSWYTAQSTATVTTGNHRYNVKSLATYIEKLRINTSSYVTEDYAQLYNIANWTVTQSGAGTDDYLYVDSGVLYGEVDSGTVELNHDPALSIAQASYPVYNLSTSGTAPEFSQYVSSWSTYSDDTRGAVTSGTLTDIKMRFDGTEDISSIKFIEDSTAPSVVRSSVNPTIPNDDEGITLKAVIEDSVEVYSVVFNAIVYPSGFSDVDYSATEVSDNLWMYSFSSLAMGNYTFKVIASDGANENALTEYAYIDFVVREAAITINPITFLGAGTDFEDVTLSFDCNRDGTYSITEWTLADESDAAETWTGSVIDGWNNIAWDKLVTSHDTVYFNFTITSGALSWTFENQYQVAQTTFYLIWASDPQESLYQVDITGRLSKTGAYAVYDDKGNLQSSGTITDQDFQITFDKWVVRDQMPHDFGIRFSNGSQVCWYNGTFYGTIEEQGGGVAISQPFGVEFWFTLTIVMTVTVIVGVTVGKQFGNIPNYGGKK